MPQATIVRDNAGDSYWDGLTLPYKILLNGSEVARYATWMQAFRHISFKRWDFVNHNEEIFAQVQSAIDPARAERAKTVDVVEQHDEGFVVFSNQSYYTVRPNHSVARERCECGDCTFRGEICKHQIAVKNFQESQKALIAKLPKVGQNIQVSGVTLCCISVRELDAAVIYSVLNGSVSLGQIKMGWDEKWRHSESLEALNTPQEAIASLGYAHFLGRNPTKFSDRITWVIEKIEYDSFEELPKCAKLTEYVDVDFYSTRSFEIEVDDEPSFNAELNYGFTKKAIYYNYQKGRIFNSLVNEELEFFKWDAETKTLAFERPIPQLFKLLES